MREKEKQRKLTKEEQKRKKAFEQLKKHMEENGYQYQELTIDIVYANIMVLVLGIPMIILVGILFSYFHGFTSAFEGRDYIFLFVIFLELVVIHELIHGITWSVFTKEGWRSISFGFITLVF